MEFTVQDRKIVFIVDGLEYSQEVIRKMIAILTDLSETNDYELPYAVPPLISRAITLIKKSSK